jgi:hypothetical protein
MLYEFTHDYYRRGLWLSSLAIIAKLCVSEVEDTVGFFTIAIISPLM